METRQKVDDKVAAIFRELASERAASLEGLALSEIVERIRGAIGSDFSSQVARDIAFHVTDWKLDAAFIVALHLFPERFTAQEIKEGVTNLIVHAPNHLAAAAKLAGYPVADVFGVGAITRDAE